MRYKLMLAIPLLALAACSRAPGEPAPAAEDTAIPVEPDGSIGDGATPLPETTATPAPAGEVAATIPAALHGRWGMVPADCTSTRGDAKGLLTIGPKTLKFYESVGTLALETARGEGMIRGQFEFSGEGMTWTRDVTLSATGDTLTRTERGGEEPGGPFTYTRCA
ncbi:hypothetical protein [Tsuneonella amylolytica]|uniref:hypothetical protein n=1 Tax=Tsuneonella amylolytica TaxID=2338327 RepID=UPI000EAA85AA|nr:hypothetical protein [Tsuneonella amylolytica]